MNNQNGKVNILFLILSASATYYYATEGRQKIESFLPDYLGLVILALLIVITVFSAFYSIFKLFSKTRSSKDIRNDIKDTLLDLSEFVDFANDRINYYDETSKFYKHEIKPIGIDSLSLAKRVIQCLAIRINQTNDLVLSSNKFDLFEAEELIQADLELTDNCVENLIGSAPCEPIPIEICIEKVSSLLDRVDVEIQSVKKAA